ncbi:hypothetical protein [Desulfosporosinus metallidurans]|uniref:hypothetical protein n=1 Tax=Desulfosporosinus metallidurans TaxID=1888891 RepID=UPI0011150A04|nr:hypothetical protein [Desulfosporosinus metallidurans]
MFPRPLTTYVPISPDQNFALQKRILFDRVARQTRLKRCLHQRGGTQDVFRRQPDTDVRFAGYPALFHQTA